MQKHKLLIIFHSQSGRAEQLAFACYRGALSDGDTEIRLRRAVDTNSGDWLWCDGIIIVTPENFGAISGGMKECLDRVYYPLERSSKQALPYALVISAGNNGTACEQQVVRILQGIRAKKVQETIIVFGAPDNAGLQECHDMAQAFAAGLSLGIF